MRIDIGLLENLWEKKMMQHPIYNEWYKKMCVPNNFLLEVRIFRPVNLYCTTFHYHNG